LRLSNRSRHESEIKQGKPAMDNREYTDAELHYTEAKVTPAIR
jgi:hypothetical protein